MRSKRKSIWTCFLLTAGVALAIYSFDAHAVVAGPDAYGYRATSRTSFSFLNIATTGARVLAGSDEDAITLNIGFPFQFYGTAYSSLCASTNGLISFRGCNSDFSNADLTAVGTTGNLPTIAPFWDDLSFAQPGADAIYYQTLGSPGKRQFVLQWNQVAGLNTPDTLTFQVVLKEGSNSIVFQYLKVDAGAPAVNAGAGATVGIRDTSGNRNGRALQWSLDTPVLRDSMAIEFSHMILPLSIDPKPGDCPKVYNLEERGVLPIAILGTAELSARDIDPSTLRLNGLSPERYAYEDAGAPIPGMNRCECSVPGKDGREDISLKFDSVRVAEALGGTALISTREGRYITFRITGKTKSGVGLEGEACLLVRSRKK